ncbi:MAG TPA: rhodanese-like domain-containing protein [Solirubrobacterales bacterium]|jgi:rhodanese-related sulfurtransferase
MEDPGSPPRHFETVSPEAVAAAIASGSLALVDVREEAEWEAGRVAVAVNVPLAALAADPGRIRTVAGSLPVAFICRSGKRSASACSIAVESGVAAVSNVGGGMKAWVAAGLSIEPRDGEVLDRRP